MGIYVVKIKKVKKVVKTGTKILNSGLGIKMVILVGNEGGHSLL